MEKLNDAECGRLYRACLQYSKTGIAPELCGNERFIFPSMKSQIDRDVEHYGNKCAINRQNGSRGGIATASVRHRTLPNAPHSPHKEKAKEKEKEKEKEKDEGYGAAAPRTPKKFIPPTLEEIEAYAKSRNSTVDPKKFFDYFNDGEWRDSLGNPVRSWKQKFITWEGSRTASDEKGGNPFAEMLRAKHDQG
jgi:hypothetical protein